MFGNHVPNCLQFILDEKVAKIAEAAEMTVSKKPGTPSDYWDYVRQRDAVAPPGNIVTVVAELEAE